MANGANRRDWLVVAAFLLAGVAWQGGVVTPYAVIMKPMAAELGWSRGEVAAESTVRFFLFALLTPLAATFTQRRGPKLLVAAGGLVLGGALIAVSQVDALWQYYGLAVFAGFSASALSFIVAGTTITLRFQRRRALAAGLAQCGTPIGSFVMASLLTQVLLWFGWRAVPLVAGVISWLVVAAAFVLLVRAGPTRSGASPEPHPGGGEAAVPRGPATSSGRSLALGQAVRTVPFWALSAVFVGDSLGASIVITHLIPHLTDLGHSPEVAALALGALAMAGIPYRIGAGWLADRLDRKRYVSMLCAGMNVSSLLLLTQTASASWLVLWVMIGGALSVMPSFLPILVSDCFGTRSHGPILGWLSLIGLLGFASGGGLAGVLYDMLGSYDLIFVGLAGVSVVNVALFSFVRPPRARAVAAVHSASGL